VRKEKSYVCPFFNRLTVIPFGARNWKYSAPNSVLLEGKAEGRARIGLPPEGRRYIYIQFGVWAFGTYSEPSDDLSRFFPSNLYEEKDMGLLRI
jgi:hypothetical protein